MLNSSNNLSGEESITALPIDRGHFLMESGLHADTWINLDALFIEPARLAGEVDALARLLAPHAPTAICGPLLGGAFVAQAVATRLGLRFYVVERSPANPEAGLFQAVYRLPAGQRSHAAHERFAVVDDVISAGSSVRATVAELSAVGASVVVIGSFLCLGERAVTHFASKGIPVVAPARRDFSMWEPGQCPHCRAGVPLQRI